MNKTLSPNYVVSPLIQKLFIALGVAGYITQLAVTLPLFFNVYGGGIRFSQYTYSVAETVLLPLVLLAIAYVAISKQASLLWRLFKSMLFVMIGLVLQVAIVQLLIIPSEGAFVQLGIQFDASIWYQVVITVLVLFVYGVIVRRYARSEVAANSIVPALQRVVVIVAWSTVVIMITLMLSRILRQLPSNPNLSSFVTTFLNIVVVPLVLFVSAYLSSYGKLILRSVRIFDAVLLSLMGVMILGVVTNIATIYRPSGIYEQWVSYETTIAAIALAVYVVMLWFARLELKKIKA